MGHGFMPRKVDTGEMLVEEYISRNNLVPDKYICQRRSREKWESSHIQEAFVKYRSASRTASS